MYDYVESRYVDEEYKPEAREIMEFWKPLGTQAKGEMYMAAEELGPLYALTTGEPHLRMVHFAIKGNWFSTDVLKYENSA